jgi:hypothetical protein
MADFEDHDPVAGVGIADEIWRDNRQFAAPSADRSPTIR